jgi:hypothetical protein
MRKVVVALFSVIVVGLMLAMPVSAGKSNVTTVPDRIGDLGKYNVNLIVGPTKAPVVPDNSWGDNAPMMDAKYVDMVSVSFGMVRNTYIFGMELAADLLRPGDPLPPGIRYVGYNWWIEDGPWDPTSTIIPKTYYQVILEFDGSSYTVYLYDAAAGTIASLPSSCITMIDARTFQIRISPDLFGNLNSFWWSAGTYVAKEYPYAWPWFTDLIDPGDAQGQVGMDFPWPPQ